MFSFWVRVWKQKFVCAVSCNLCGFVAYEAINDCCNWLNATAQQFILIMLQRNEYYCSYSTTSEEKKKRKLYPSLFWREFGNSPLLIIEVFMAAESRKKTWWGTNLERVCKKKTKTNKKTKKHKKPHKTKHQTKPWKITLLLTLSCDWFWFRLPVSARGNIGQPGSFMLVALFLLVDLAWKGLDERGCAGWWSASALWGQALFFPWSQSEIWALAFRAYLGLLTTNN